MSGLPSVGEVLPHTINNSGRNIDISQGAASKLLGIDGFNEQWLRKVVVRFTDSAPQDMEDSFVFGQYQSLPTSFKNPLDRLRIVRVHMGSIERSVLSGVDLPTYSYDPQASLERNASASLLHELMHARDEVALLEDVFKKRKFLGRLGVWGLSPELKVRPALHAKEIDVRLRVNALFDRSDDFDRLVRIHD